MNKKPQKPSGLFGVWAGGESAEERIDSIS
jgi:hypothetical protein